jgi:hypothetical protein
LWATLDNDNQDFPLLTAAGVRIADGEPFFIAPGRGLAIGLLPN